MYTFDQNTRLDVVNSLIPILPTRGRAILKVEIPISRINLHRNPKSLRDLESFTSVEGISRVTFTLVGCWETEVPYELGSKVLIGVGSVQPADVSYAVTQSRLITLSDKMKNEEIEVRKAGGDVNILLPREYVFSTYVMVSSFDIQCNVCDNLESLLNE